MASEILSIRQDPRGAWQTRGFDSQLGGPVFFAAIGDRLACSCWKMRVHNSTLPDNSDESTSTVLNST